MAYCEIKYFSKALEKAAAATILLPECARKGPYAVLYLLHGLSDDNTAWTRRTSVERYVQDLPLIVVMPDSGRGFYTDAAEGMAYETAITRDLVGYVDQMFNTNPSRSARCLAGLSMGGYGAIKLALKHPNLFCAAASHSGALGFSHWALGDDAFGTEMKRVVGANSPGGENDLYALSESVELTLRPALKIDCGVDDFLLNDNRAFTEHLNKIGYSHLYQEFHGAHNWAYWDLHVQESLRFLVNQIGLDNQG